VTRTARFAAALIFHPAIGRSNGYHKGKALGLRAGCLNGCDLCTHWMRHGRRSSPTTVAGSTGGFRSGFKVAAASCEEKTP
jgi:hypothetical protein